MGTLTLRAFYVCFDTRTTSQICSTEFNNSVYLYKLLLIHMTAWWCFGHVEVGWRRTLTSSLTVCADEATGAGTTLPRTVRCDGVTSYQLFWLAQLWPDMHQCNTPDQHTHCTNCSLWVNFKSGNRKWPNLIRHTDHSPSSTSRIQTSSYFTV